jgi:SAM-dependent methyltransferase
MDPRHLQELHNQEATYWWPVNKRRIVLNFLDRFARPDAHVLEIGCGGGYFSAQLSKRYPLHVAADISPQSVQFAHQEGCRLGAVFNGNEGLPFASESFDAVLILDVLEHLEKDELAAAEIRRVLKPGGVMIATVPAYPALFSTWDRILEHKRRYSRHQFRTLCEGAGLHIERLSFWNLISLPPALLIRGRDRLSGNKRDNADFPKIPKWLNVMFEAWGILENAILGQFNIPAGLSLVAVCKKPDPKENIKTGK